MADGTVVLPAVTNLRDKQTVLITSTQEITALVVDENGAGSIYGEPTSLSAEGFFKMKYDLALDAWFRVG